MEKVANYRYVFFAVFFFVSLTVSGQETPLDIKVSLQLKDKTIEDIIKELHKISGVNFSYSTNYFPDNKQSIRVFNKAIKEVLSEAFENTHLSYKVVGNQIIIFHKDNKGKFTISGYVRDKETGETLISANIYEPILKVGTTTNIYGFFSLTLQASDSVFLVIKYIGYQPKVFNLKLDRDIKLDIKLSPSIDLKTVEIVEERIERIEEQTQMSAIEIPISQIKFIPALLGEVDVLKSMQLLPGVQSGSEGSSGLYVRGGGPDQNLILLDGAPVYNASHLFGFFSIFNTDAIKNVQLTKGGFPARYGGRLSSIVEINMKEGNMNKISGEGSLGLVASKLTLEGPIIKNKASFIVSGRRTYVDILARPIIKAQMQGGSVGYYFYDLNMKLNYKVSEKNHLFLNFYSGDDRFNLQDKNTKVAGDMEIIREENVKFGWGNMTSTLRWNRIITPRLFCNTSLIYSRFNFNIEAISSNKEKTPTKTITRGFSLQYISGIQDWNGKINFDFIPSPDHVIKFGAGNIYHEFNTGALQSMGNEWIENIPATIERNPLYAHEMSAYIEDEWTISSSIKANIGLRYDAFLVKDKYYKSVQPRISYNYRINKKWTLKGSYVTVMQFIHLLSNAGIGLPTDLWVPSTNFIRPQESRQIAAGTDRALKFLGEEYGFSLEAYYKYMKNIIEYKTTSDITALIIPSIDWAEKIEIGHGWSYGVEFFFQKKTGKTTGWVGYTLSWTERQFENLNYGKKFPYKYDRRHNFSFVISHEIKENIDIAATWVYGTGNAISMPLKKYQELKMPYGGENILYSYGERNNFRMRSYHRLDLGVNFRKAKKWGERTINIGLYNAYSRRNPFYYEMYSDWNTGKIKIIQISFFPIIPAITYNFKF